jgi:hypothetical protein
MKKWNSINKRLKNIICEDLDIKFIHCPLVKKTSRSEICIPFFYVKLDGKIIWSYPKDCAYDNWQFDYKWAVYVKWNRPYLNECEKVYGNNSYASPENIIAGYLDMPKDKLLEFDEPTGLKYLLWACDKRIGKNRLQKMQFTEQALPIVKKRIPNHNLEPYIYNSMTLVYSANDLNIFGNSENWCFNTSGYDNTPNKSYFIIADNKSYSNSKTINKITFDGRIKKLYNSIVSKKRMELTQELSSHIIKALSSPSKHIKGKTVWEELIIIENSTTDIEQNKIPLDKPLFEKIIK